MPTIDLGKVVGPKGEKGDTGPQGVQGIQGIQGQTGPGVVPGGAENSLLAKNSTVDYDTKWMTMSQVGTELVKPDNPVGVALSGKASNPNLLDDWYFVGGGSQQGGGQFPINQRGETEYTGTGYTIDRWKFDTNGTALSIHDGYISLSFNGSAWWKSFVQTLEGFNEPIQLTVSIMYRSSNPPNFILIGNLLTASAEWTVASYTGTFTPNADGNLIISLLLSYVESEIDIRAAKLELGSVQTLAHQDASGNWVLNDPPPNFQQELAKCQRYQVLGNLEGIGLTPNLVFFPLCNPVRSANPSLIGDFNVRKQSDNSLIDGASVAFRLLCANGVVVSVTGAGNEPIYINVPGHGGFDFNL